MVGAQDVKQARADTKGSPNNHYVGTMEKKKCCKKWEGNRL